MASRYSAAMHSQPLTYRPAIDGLRAIAVLGVVLYHAGFGPPGGFVGVDVFFVISGFLITSLLEAELDLTQRVDIAAFYARRARRLLPALGVVLLATVAGCYVVLPPYAELRDALASAAASLVFGANVFFQYTTGDYFGPNVNHLPLLHLWSLGVEEQFYLLWPVALFASRRIRPGARRAAFAACAIASLAFAEWAIYQGSQAAFYAMPSRWWELSLGAVAAWLPRPSHARARWESLAGMVIILGAMALPAPHFPGIGALPATLGAALVVHASTSEAGGWGVLSSRPAVFIGLVSYPFYLWHWPLLALASVALPGELPLATRGALVAAAFLLAVGTARWVEQPGRRLSLAQPGKFALASLLGCVAMCVLLVQLSGMQASAPPPTDAGNEAASDMPRNIYECHNNSMRPVSMPDEVRCSLGHGQPVRVAIWGDSHALALQPFAAVVATQLGVSALGYSRDSCPPALGYHDGEHPQIAVRCDAFNKAALERVEHMDTVILAARWPGADAPGFASSLTATVDALASHVRKVIIVGPTPVLPAAVPDCIRTHALERCELPRDQFIAQTADTRAFLEAVAHRHANIEYVEPLDFFCDPRACPGVRRGLPLYWDDNHIASRAAAAFGRTYVKQLETATHH
jgi:peptidoglycan/LPS O-acetylase OafA/YrhL